jgi:eukaryotic-like serine/threonine-protein kinase
MSLEKGTRVGPYEINGTLGVGGMGEVYRAHDARLARDVALKVLPEHFAADPERLARFAREAQVLAALKHPNIAAIYGLEEGGAEGDHVRALVLELVEGETLADRVARGPIPVDEAVSIAKQIAEALQAAHEQGVIHRDLKPSNIKITPDEHVRVLDFGLAKLTEAGGASKAGGASEGALAQLSMSPTITSPAATGIGVILGTAAYMAPEQAKGRPADKRSDVWAFGCVLYEMLAGKRAFEADDISDTLALVLKGEPDWTALPSNISSSIRALIRSCLEKDPRTRLADMSGALFVVCNQSELTPVGSLPVSAAKMPRWQRLALVAAVVVLIVLMGAGVWFATRPTTPQVTRFSVTSPEEMSFVTGGRPGTSVAISPDGRMLAFTARDKNEKVMLWLRPIEALTAQPLAGTDGAQFPFWSPDSRSIGYFVQGKLLKIGASGGPPVTLCAVNLGRGGTWNRDGEIIYGENTGPLFRVSSAGGAPVAMTKLDSAVQDHRFPSFLPDGRHALYFNTTTEGNVGVSLLSLDTGETRRLIDADTGAVYDSHSGHLLFGRQGTLMAQPFDANTFTLSGEPFPIGERLESGVYAGIVSFSVADSGTLAYGMAAAAAAGLRLVRLRSKWANHRHCGADRKLP